MTWTAGTISTVDPWNCITFGNGTFVTVANITGNTASSTDGITWRQGSSMPWNMPWGNTWQDATYTGSKFCAIGWAYSSAESLDGVNNWYQTALPYQRYWGGVANSPNTLVAVGTGYSASLSSPYRNSAVAVTNDPHDWGSSVMDRAAHWTDVAYGNGRFVAVTGDSNAASVSTSQGRSWITGNTLPAAQHWTAINFGNNQFVTVGNSNVAAVSTDGATWTSVAMPANQQWVDVAYGKGKWIAIAANSNTAAVSSNGITWTANTLPSSQTWTAIVFGGDCFVAVAANTAVTAVLV